MKVYVLLVVATIITFFGCATGETKAKETTVATDTANYTTIRWIDSVKDIGIITTGRVAEIKFRFKNTGEKPLFIVSAKPGCGCTVADYPKEAIMPNAEGVITANYDSNKGGGVDFRKSINVVTNTKGSNDHYIFFYGKVLTAEDSAKQKIVTDTTTANNYQKSLQ